LGLRAAAKPQVNKTQKYFFLLKYTKMLVLTILNAILFAIILVWSGLNNLEWFGLVPKAIQNQLVPNVRAGTAAKPNVGIILFTLNGCHFCEDLKKVVWPQFVAAAAKSTTVNVSFTEIEKSNPAYAQFVAMVSSAGAVTGYPTIFKTVNGKPMKYTGDRSLASLMQFASL
jgi:hypothetical protein